jgi:hypothetical protein
MLDQHADVAIGLGQLHEVGQRVHVAVAVAALVVDLLPLAHHAQVAVVQRHDLDRRVVLQAGRQLLDAHLHRAFAGDAVHLAVGLGQLDAHGVGNAHAHGAQAAGVDPAARLGELVVLRGPHLVLADVGRDVGVDVLGQVPQRLDDVLRLDDVQVLAVVLQAVALAPALDLLPPRAQRPVGLGGRFLDHRDQLGQHLLHVADDRDVDLHPLGDAGRVDVDVDDLAFVLGEVLGVADHAVVEPRADGQQHVAVLHRVVGLERAVHAQHAQELGSWPEMAPRPISVLVHG